MLPNAILLLCNVAYGAREVSKKFKMFSIFDYRVLYSDILVYLIVKLLRRDYDNSTKERVYFTYNNTLSKSYRLYSAITK